MDKTIKFFIILLFTITQCFAIEVIPISKDEPAPKDGFFIDSNNMKKMRQINEDKKLLEKENSKLKNLSDLQEERVDIYKDEWKQASKQVSKERTKGTLKGIGGFLLGVVATSLATYAAIKVVK